MALVRNLAKNINANDVQKSKKFLTLGLPTVSNSIKNVILTSSDAEFIQEIYEIVGDTNKLDQINELNKKYREKSNDEYQKEYSQDQDFHFDIYQNCKDLSDAINQYMERHNIPKPDLIIPQSRFEHQDSENKSKRISPGV